MRFNAYLTNSNSSGIFELKTDGTVLYSRFRKNNRLLSASEEFVGHNFFEEVADFDNACDLREIFDKFIESEKFTDTIVFLCLYDKRVVPVRIMMVRAVENAYLDPDGIVIMDIKTAVTEIS